MGEPSHLSPLSHRGHRGHCGERARTKRPCPSIGPCYLMLLFPTRQTGVSSHHPSRLQAIRTTKASSSVTASQVSKASLHQRLPPPSPKPRPASCAFAVPSPCFL